MSGSKLKTTQKNETLSNREGKAMDNLEEIVQACGYDPEKIGCAILEKCGYFVQNYGGYVSIYEGDHILWMGRTGG